MNAKDLRIEMLKHDDNVKALAEYLGIAPVTMSRKLHGLSDFTQTEMIMIKNRYELSDEEFVRIFAKEVEV